MRFSPDRAGWVVLTRNYRLALGLAVAGALFGLLMAVTLVLGVVRHHPFQWQQALWLLVAVLWTVRMVGNVLWLRRPGND